MFWTCEERRMTRALRRFKNRFTLSSDAEVKLDDLIGWITKYQDEPRELWSHDELFEALMSGESFDKEAVLEGINEEMQSLQMFSNTLVDKLAAFH